MNEMMENTTGTAKALTMVWLGTPVVAAAVFPLVFPLVVAGGLVYLATHQDL